MAGSRREYVRVHSAQNSVAFPVTPGRFHVIRRGSRATVVAVGPVLDPVLDPVLAAVSDLDVTVLYAASSHLVADAL